MSDLFLILMIAFIAIIFIIACLALGWLFKGKKKPCGACKDKDENNQKT